jgi:hypothetical protein
MLLAAIWDLLDVVINLSLFCGDLVMVFTLNFSSIRDPTLSKILLWSVTKIIFRALARAHALQYHTIAHHRRSCDKYLLLMYSFALPGLI